MKSIYLDTSAIVKRYVVEPGSDYIDEIYEKSYMGKLTLGFSSWNIGEVAVVFDKYERRGVIKGGRAIFEEFLEETRLLLRRKLLKIVPVNRDI